MIRTSFFKGTVLSEKDVYHFEELCSCGSNCFFMSPSFLSFPFIVFPEEGGVSSCRISHYPYYSPCMGTPLLRDFVLTLVFPTLLDNRVKTTETYEFSFGGESLYTSYLCHKGDGRAFPDSWNGCKDTDFSFEGSFCYTFNELSYLSSFLLKVEESFDFKPEEFLCHWEITSDRGLGKFEYFLYPFYFSSSCCWDGLEEGFPWKFLYYLGRREIKEYGEGIFGKDREFTFELREEDREKGFDLGFSFSYGLGDSLLLSYKGFNHLSDWWRRVIFLSASHKEPTDCFSVFGIGLRGFRVKEAEEIFQSCRMDNRYLISSFSEEGEEIEVVDTSGFHTNEEGIFKGRDYSFEGEEAVEVHREGRRGDKGGAIGESEGKGIFGGIDTTKIVNHFKTSEDGLEGLCSPLNLPVKVCLKSTINQYETGRAEDLLPCEPKSSGNMESHPSSGLFFIKLSKKFKYHIFT